jgi:cephalosporin-C deacetylase-like acetyl esterase
LAWKAVHSNRQSLDTFSSLVPLDRQAFRIQRSITRISYASGFSKILAATFILMFLLQSASAQDAATADAKHFDYDTSAALALKEISVQQRNGVSIHDITYNSPNGGTVPAYLVVPKGSGKFAAILWGHWLMPGSSSSSREEFLDEAVTLAPAGVISLLIDAPSARPGFKPVSNPAVTAQQVIDLRRGVDLLLARADVDPKRIAYVGHSWDAGAGAILDAVDKRIAAFVFMGGPQSTREYFLASDSPRTIEARKGKDLAKIEQAMTANAWSDPGTYAKRLGPAPALFQYGLKDEDWVPIQDARDYVSMSTGPKVVKFYESGHALNSQARIDRFDFLQQHLSLLPVSREVLESIPDAK